MNTKEELRKELGRIILIEPIKVLISIEEGKYYDGFLVLHEKDNKYNFTKCFKYRKIIHFNHILKNISENDAFYKMMNFHLKKQQFGLIVASRL